MFFKILSSTLVFNIDFASYSIVFYLPPSDNGISGKMTALGLMKPLLPPFLLAQPGPLRLRDPSRWPVLAAHCVSLHLQLHGLDS